MLTVEDILMTKGPDVIITPPHTTVKQAVALMAEANVGSVIVQSDADVLGIFTERDLLRRVVAAEKDPADTRLDEVMSAPVRSCSLTDNVAEAAAKLTSEHIRHLVVMQDGALIGLIGIRDVMAAELREKDRALRELQAQAS